MRESITRPVQMSTLTHIGCIFTALCSPLLIALSPIKEAEDRRLVNDPAILEAIQAPQANLRSEAAIALGRIQKAEGVDALLALTHDKDTRVQKDALFALGQLGWEKSFSGAREAEIAKTLQTFTASTNNEVKRLAIESIGKLGLNETPTFIIHLLSDPNPKIRAETLMALYRYRLVQKLRDPSSNPSLLNEEQINSVLKLENDSHQEVLRTLAYYFWRVKDERGKAIVLKLTQSKDLWTRFYAVNALSKYDDPALAPIVLEATEDDSYHVRSAAVSVATTKKLSTGLNSTLRGDPSYHVRVAYVQSLSALAPEIDAKEKLLGLYSNTNTSVKAESLKALSKFPDTFNLVLQALEDNSWVLRSAAAASATNFSNREKQDILEKSLADADVRVRVSALEVLAETHEPYAYSALTSALKSPEISERGSAVAALNSRKEESRMQLAFSCYHNSQDEKWVELREEIVKLWASLVSDETNSYLRSASQDPSRGVAQLAVKILLERGITDATINSNEEQLSFSPYRELSFKRDPKIIFQTSKGELTFVLYHKEAPIHVANIVGFAQENKYNGLPFHRVVSNFVVQGGDPDKSGWGSAGYSLRAEVNQKTFERGTIGMPRSTAFDTGGIQFFINHIPTPHLNGQYTVMGHVTDGLDVLDQIEVGDLIISARIEL